MKPSDDLQKYIHELFKEGLSETKIKERMANDEVKEAEIRFNLSYYKRKKILRFAIPAAILIIMVLYFLIFPPAANKESVAMSNNNTVDSGVVDTGSATNDVPTTNNLSVEEKNINTAVSLYNQAIEAGDTTLCQKINDSLIRADCFANINRTHVNQQLLDDTKFFNQAITKNDSEICKKIQDEDTQSICLETLR